MKENYSYKVQPMISIDLIVQNRNTKVCRNDLVVCRCMVSISILIVREEEIMPELYLALIEGVDHW